MSHSTPTEIMQQITDTQDHVVQLRDTRDEFERNLAELNAQIDAEVTLLAELQEQLNHAIAAATHRAVGG